MNQYKKFFDQTFTPWMHRKFAEHEELCVHSNQLPPKTPNEENVNSNKLTMR